jgi:hypothetical protein
MSFSNDFLPGYQGIFASHRDYQKDQRSQKRRISQTRSVAKDEQLNSLSVQRFEELFQAKFLLSKQPK